ncbi:MAG: phasin family protein [Burkholderiales bacterium]|nr:phasin family protein [Burkholderiales bacterium]
MVMNPEQLIAAQKAQFENLFNMVTKTMDSMEKLVTLSMQTVKSTLQDSAEETMAKMSAKDLQSLTTQQGQWMEPLAERMLSYAQHVQQITSGAQAEIAKNAEAQVAEMHRQFMALVDSSAKHAPAGSEPAVAMMKTAIQGANAAYESVRKASKQAGEMAEKNLHAATTAARQSVEAASTRSRRKT